jgi:hypothetical protein
MLDNGYFIKHTKKTKNDKKNTYPRRPHERLGFGLQLWVWVFGCEKKRYQIMAFPQHSKATATLEIQWIFTSTTQSIDSYYTYYQLKSFQDYMHVSHLAKSKQ